MHLELDLYLLVIRRLLSPEALVRLAHEHMLETCSVCRIEHDVDREPPEEDEELPQPPPPMGSGPAIPEPVVPDPASIPPLPDDPRLLSQEHLEPRLAVIEEVRRIRDRDRRQLKHLLTVPPEGWIDEIAAARSRYRHRSFAERLIEESRQRVRHDPVLARRLAALVPVVLYWIPGALDTPWAEELRLRSLAWQANALRVSGDLEAAQARFQGVDLHRLLATGSWAAGEIASLLASLRIDQRRMEEALKLLEVAREIFLRVGDKSSAARTLIKQGNLFAVTVRPEGGLASFEEAANLIAQDPHRTERSLYESAILTGRVYALCDLERFQDAEELLNPHLPLSKIEDPHLRSLLRYNRGRIEVGQGRPDRAVPDLVEAQASFLESGRIYDAALVSLDLAHAYLKAGRAAEAQELARDLVPQFEARGVTREALAALSVLAEAVTTETLTRQALTHLRHQLTTAPR